MNNNTNNNNIKINIDVVKDTNNNGIKITKEFFDAAYAHHLATSSSNENLQDHLSKVYNKINKAAKLGLFNTTINYMGKHIPNGLISYLKNKGFNVKLWQGDQRDPACDLIISW